MSTSPKKAAKIPVFPPARTFHIAAHAQRGPPEGGCLAGLGRRSRFVTIPLCT